MGLFQKIRDLFGLTNNIEDSPIESYDKLLKKSEEIQNSIEEARNEFDETTKEFDLKIQAANLILEKGENENISFNKKVFEERIEKVTNEYLFKSAELYNELKKVIEESKTLESEILKSSIEITTSLSEEESEYVGKLMKAWELSGEILGEKIDTQIHAIVTSLDYVVRGEEELEKAQSEAKSDYKPIIKVPKEPESYEGHYANTIVKDNEDKILFLKRAKDKVIAPDQYCLPGGHIDGKETIEQAALRELKEEAGLTANSAYLRAKAKCKDGKWAFYLTAYPQEKNVTLTDEESSGYAWMSKNEWLEADLIFDLKDHLRALECQYDYEDVSRLPEIKKAEEALLEEEQDVLIKGRAAQVGEKRNWSGIEYVKVKGGEWIRTKDNEKEKKKEKDKTFKHSTDQLVAHAENTSEDQLKKVVADESRPQEQRDAAKRELERRKADQQAKANKTAVKKKPKKESESVGLADYTVGYAPFREGNITDLNDSQKAFQDKGYKGWKKMAAKFADLIGIKIAADHNTVGIYGSTSVNAEASSLTTVSGDSQKVELFAALMGTLAPDTQHSVMTLEYSSKGTTGEHRISFKDSASAQDFIKLRKKYGIDDVSFIPDKNTVVVLEFEGGKFNKEKLLTDYGEQIKGLEENRVNAKFIGEDEYGGIVQKARGSISKQYGKVSGEDYSDVLRLAQERLNKPKIKKG